MPHEVTLATVPLFSQLPRRTLTRLGRAMIERRFKRGQTIVKEGDKADAFFIVESGKVEVIGGRGKKASRLNELGAGSYFGEMALVDGAPRSATVKAVNDTDCLVLPRRALMAEIKTSPQIAMSMLTALSMHSRQDARDPRPMEQLLRFI
jgi:CRP-like cAMP-binding protein